jgi:hypothetical protein
LKATHNKAEKNGAFLQQSTPIGALYRSESVLKSMMSRKPWSWRLVFALTAALIAPIALASCPAVRAHMRAAAVLSRASNAHNYFARSYDEPIVVQNLLLHTRHGAFRARVYRPAYGSLRRPGVVVAHGVHYLGIDEPRLVPFARNLARSGVVVLTPELAALADYRVARSSVEELIEAARVLAARSDVSRGKIGLFGLSFAGGLSLVAASEPAGRAVIDRVAVMGAHHDLRRTLRFLATDTVETPSGIIPMHAHDYGLVVYVYMNAERFVLPEEVAVFRDCLRLLLHVEHAQATQASRVLQPATRALFERIARGDKSAVRSVVMRALEQSSVAGSDGARSARELSPAGRQEALRGVVVSLMHGAADDVVPPTEAQDCARELAQTTDVTLLLTPSIRHVGVEGTPSLRDQLAIVHSFARLIGE